MTAENELFRLGVPARFLCLASVVAEGVFDLCGGLINLRAGQTALDAPFDRFGAARGDPDRRMGLLHRPWPDRAVVQFEKRALVAPHRLGPGGHDQVVGFFETAARFFRVYPVPNIFRRNATDETGDQPAVTEAIDHGVLFGNAHRMIAQRQDVAEDADFYFLGSLAERGGDQVGGRHRAVGAVVMLVENDAVKTEFLAVGHFGQMLRVVRHTLGRIEIAARHRRARRLGGYMGIGEQIEIVELHEFFAP